ARESVTTRSKLQKDLMMKENEQKEKELRALPQKARSERVGPGGTVCHTLKTMKSRSARESVTTRSKLQKDLMMKENEQKEKELRALPQKARSERVGPGGTVCHTLKTTKSRSVTDNESS
nr:SNW/SKI-interacting protein [Tanacetum cinerariifolium]